MSCSGPASAIADVEHHHPGRRRRDSRYSRRVPAGLVASGFFAFRTPLLPAEELDTFGRGLAAPGAADLPAALAEDRSLLRARLRAALLLPEVREAIFVASPSLEESLVHWLRDPESERGQKVERSLVRYYARMAGRPTPFGLFAGCSIGAIGPETRLALAPRAEYRRHTRLDMDYVSQLAAALGADAEVRARVRYRPNSSLYRASGKWRYAEGRMDGRARSYHLVAVEPTDYLDATLARARGGARAGELAAALVDADVTAEDAAAYVNELVDSQLLVPELEPGVTGPEPIHGLIDTLASAAPAAAATLAAARDALAALDAGGVGAEPQRYRDIARGLEALPAPVELPRLFQVDMVKPAPGATLGQAVVDEIARAVEALHRMAGPGGHDGLRRFREAFERRYETREVPLAEALDEESGIGFDTSSAPGADASPLLAGVDFPGAAPAEPTVPWGAREAFLLRRLVAGGDEIVLEEKDLKLLQRDPGELPDALAAMGAVYAESEDALRRGEFRVHLHSAAGPSGAVLLGRFCHADPALAQHVRAHLRAEEALRPDAILAEIVHLPEGRTGNVLHRPLLRDHEIVFLGRSGAPDDRQILVDDLWVTVRGPRILLRSARLGREVIPRLTNAHNFSVPRNLSVYRFLCSLSRDGVSGVAWGWGALDSAPYLPRVRIGRTLVAVRRWRVRKEELGVADAKGADAYRAVQRLREARRLPRHVLVADGDNELPIDLDNALCVDTFVHLTRERPEFMLTEVVDGDVARGPEGRFVQEIVVPFVRPPKPRPSGAPALSRPAERRFAPGSRWLYVKLYGGPAAADEVLTEALAPLVARAGFAAAVDRWFFIRYADPDPHLRVRFRGEPAALSGWVRPVLDAALAPFLADGRLWRVQLDTYEREVERYGGPDGIELAEELFRADSDAVLAVVGALQGDEGADRRWRIGLVAMDRMLDDLGLDLAAKVDVARRARDGFRAEFHVAAPLDRQLGDKFRKLRLELERLLAEAPPEAVAARSPKLAAIAAALRELHAAGRLSVPLTELAPSYLHMHVNRLLRSAQRPQEMILYDFLYRLYEGRQKRKR